MALANCPKIVAAIYTRGYRQQHSNFGYGHLKLRIKKRRNYTDTTDLYVAWLDIQ